MPETDPAAEPENPNPALPPADPPEADPQLGDAGKKALDAMKAERAAAKREAAELAKRLKAYEDRDKTDSEKAAEALKAAEGRATAAEREVLRMRVAAELAVPAELHEFLTGDSEDELRAKAEKLAALSSAPKRPRPDPGQGARPDGTPSIDDQILQAQAKGDFRTVIALQNQKLAKASRP